MPSTVSIRKINREDHSVMPWKNGGGTTREVATGGGAGGEWGWRVSIATVERDGAYSEYPGVDRTTTVVVGNGSDLFHPDGSTIALNPLKPTLIPSDVALWGILRDDPILNFNVMTRQGAYMARVSVHDGSETRSYTIEDEELLVHMLAGSSLLSASDGKAVSCGEDETLLRSGKGTATLQIDNGARAVVVRIHPTS